METKPQVACDHSVSRCRMPQTKATASETSDNASTNNNNPSSKNQ